MSISFQTSVGTLNLKSPLLAASGTWAYGMEFLDHPVNASLAGFVTKSLSLEPSEGNPMPRLYETDGGLLNSIGLQNMGIDAFLSKVDPELKKRKVTYILSVYAKNIGDFERLAEKANQSSAKAVEFNMSCPNVDQGGLEFSSDPKTTEKLVASVKKYLKKPLWAKLSPNVTSIADIATAAESGGADALSMINTLVGMAIDVDHHKPWLGRMVGGLSGPAIRPVAVEKVFRCYKKVKVPIVGMGGIHSGRDVLEFLMAGATAVQIGTWNFRDPFSYSRILNEIKAFCERKGFPDIGAVVGLAHR